MNKYAEQEIQQFKFQSRCLSHHSLKYSTLECGNCGMFAEHHTGGSFVAEWYRYDLVVSAFQLLESRIAYSVGYLRFIGGNYLKLHACLYLSYLLVEQVNHRCVYAVCAVFCVFICGNSSAQVVRNLSLSCHN